MAKFHSGELPTPLLIDGGLSYALSLQGCDLNHSLWTARLLDKNPNAIVNAHLSFLRAGAQVLITSSYQASIAGFMNSGFSQSRSIELMLTTAELARESQRRFSNEQRDAPTGWVADSIGPYGAFLADGSEYTGQYNVSDSELTAFHMEKIKLLGHSAGDFFAVETIPSFREACVLNEIIRQSSKMAWVSFSCRDERSIHDGTTIREAVAIFNSNRQVFAVGVNCTRPEFIPALTREIKATCPEKRIVVYPNSGEQYDAATKQWSGENSPHLCGMRSTEWLSAGADIIGGCCRIGPETIAAIGAMLRVVDKS